MATWYVRGTNGNDANAGTSRALAFKTMAAANAVVASGDTIKCSETLIGTGAFVKTANNLTIEQDPDGDQFIWFGGTALTPGTWVDAGGGVYTYATGVTGLGADGLHVLFNYLTSTNSRGSHFGTLKREAASGDVDTAAGLGGLQGNYFYNTLTGGIRAYFGGDDPRLGVTHTVVRKEAIAIDLTGTGNTVNGLWFKAWHNEGQGACVWLKDGTASGLITNCKSWDSGPHAFICSGQTALMTNNTISNCFSDGAKAAQTAHFTFFQQGGFGNTSGLRMTNCHVERHSWFNIDESEVAACEQQGFYAHASAGTPIVDVLLDGCTSTDAVVVTTPIVDCDNHAAPSDPADWSTYNFRCDRCSFGDMAKYRFYGHMAMRRTVIGLQQMGSSAECLYSPGGNGALAFRSASQDVLFESCVFPYDSTPAANNDSIIFFADMGQANVDARFVNCTFVDLCTSNAGRTGTARTFAHMLADAGQNFAFTGCIFACVSTDPDGRNFAYTEGSAVATQLDLSDCAYGFAYDTFIFGPGWTAAAPANEDANANVFGDDPFVDAAAGNYRIDSGSALYGDARATTTVEPANLINGAYDGSFGAYAQFDESGGGVISSGPNIARHSFHRRHQLTRRTRR